MVWYHFRKRLVAVMTSILGNYTQYYAVICLNYYRYIGSNHVLLHYISSIMVLVLPGNRMRDDANDHRMTGVKNSNVRTAYPVLFLRSGDTNFINSRKSNKRD